MVTGRILLGYRIQKGVLPVTVDDVIYRRRVRVLTLADELGNVSEACRLVGVSRLHGMIGQMAAYHRSADHL